jgi:hypothetical protein
MSKMRMLLPMVIVVLPPRPKMKGQPKNFVQAPRHYVTSKGVCCLSRGNLVISLLLGAIRSPTLPSSNAFAS